jgi:O-Antigen ligase
MLVVIAIQLVIVVSLIWTSRKGLENALPVLCFFLVLMPLESRIVIPGLFDFNTMRVSLLTLLILYFYRREPSYGGPIPLKRLMFLHIGWAICSTLYSLSVATSAKQLISQVLEYYLLYFLLVRTISSVQTLYKIVFAMVMAMSLCCVFSLLEAYATWSILRIFPSNLWITYNGGVDPLYIEWGRGLRVRSTFPHPILFGDALAMCIPLTLYLLSVWEVRWQRFVLWISLVLMFWAIYKTSSRGPWLATGLCSALLFVMIRNRIRKYLLTIAVLVVAVLLARPGIWQTIEGLYQSSTDSTSPVGSSYLYRNALSEAVKGAVAKEPGRLLLGYGLGTFRELGLDINFLNTVQRWYTCDDNWAAFLYETGYVGLILISILLFTPLLMALRNYWVLPRPDNEFSGVIFISLLGFYFLLLSVAGYSWGQQGYMSWILISLSVCHPRVLMLRGEFEEQEHEEEDSKGLEEEYDLHVA